MGSRFLSRAFAMFFSFAHFAPISTHLSFHSHGSLISLIYGSISKSCQDGHTAKANGMATRCLNRVVLNRRVRGLPLINGRIALVATTSVE